jgi:hypothetical protein
MLSTSISDSPASQSNTAIGHPLAVARALAERYGEGLRLTFSKYLYRPRTVFDEREAFECPAAIIDDDWLAHQKLELKPNWELALNSLVHDSRSRARHIPMIDFAVGAIGRDELLLMDRILGKTLTKDFVYYETGRSFHAYGLALISPSGWRTFMAKLLLLNLPDRPQLIDARWVGHRLLSGYSALRWTANNPQYLQTPRRKEFRF